MSFTNTSANTKVRMIKIAIGGAVLIGLGAGKLLWDIKPKKLKIAEHVDWDKFQGVWYEIVRSPVNIERRSFTNITFEYRNIGKESFDIEMHYQTKEGYLGQLTGDAKIINSPKNSKFEVRYLPSVLKRLKKSDYVVLHVDADYQFALIGQASRKNFWLLARSPKVNQQFVDNYLEIVRKAGYKLSDLTYVSHT